MLTVVSELHAENRLERHRGRNRQDQETHDPPVGPAEPGLLLTRGRCRFDGGCGVE